MPYRGAFLAAAVQERNSSIARKHIHVQDLSITAVAAEAFRHEDVMVCMVNVMMRQVSTQVFFFFLGVDR